MEIILSFSKEARKKMAEEMKRFLLGWNDNSYSC